MKKYLAILLLLIFPVVCLADEESVDWDKIETALYSQLKSENKFKSDAEIYQAMGYGLLQSDNQRERAVVYFKKAVKTDPALYVSWYNLGLIYADEEERRDYFRKCIKAKKDYAPAYYWLAYSLCRSNREIEALPIFEKYLKVAKDDSFEEGRIKVATEIVEEIKSSKTGKNLKMIKVLTDE